MWKFSKSIKNYMFSKNIPQLCSFWYCLYVQNCNVIVVTCWPVWLSCTTHNWRMSLNARLRALALKWTTYTMWSQECSLKKRKIKGKYMQLHPQSGIGQLYSSSLGHWSCYSGQWSMWCVARWSTTLSSSAPYDCEKKWRTYNAWSQSGLSTHCYTGEQTSRNYGRYSQKVCYYSEDHMKPKMKKALVI